MIPTLLQTAESHAFYDPPEKREVKRRLDVNKKIESLVPLFELHLDVGEHTVSRISQYDAIRRDWALKFSSSLDYLFNTRLR